MTVTTPTIKPEEILDSSQIKYLRTKSSLMGTLLVAHAWLVIFSLLFIYTLFPSFILYLVVITLIAGRQLGLAILMHEGAHGLIANNVRFNNYISQFFCAFPMAVDTYDYRHYHLKHHRHTQTEDDPDLVLSKPFPITKSSFIRKMLRDLTGITGIKQRYQSIQKTFDNDTLKVDGKEISGFKSKATLRGIFLSQILIFISMSIVGNWWYYFAFWIVPALTIFQFFYRIRNIAEHAVVPNDCDDFNNARTTNASFIERCFVAPYYVNYHLEHHLFMFIPCYKLKDAHNLLVAKKYTNRMEIKKGYIPLLKSILV
jgi:fatty acid desaturase